MEAETKSRTLLAAAFVAMLACGGAGGQSSAPGPSADVGAGHLQGAGATFPEPFYTRAFYQYSQMHQQVTVNYQAIGSGGGIQQFTKNTVDFGASDVPMTAKEVADAGGEDSVVQIPTTIGVISIPYNLPDVARLQLDGPTLAAIYLGTAKRWDDAAIKALNPSAKLPSKDITVVHRSDGSGTTYAFTDYLARVSPEWKSSVGVAKAVQWPAGVGGQGNAGVGQQVKTTEGAIGYVELAYVIQSKLQHAYVKNRAGKYLQASLDGATAAAGTLRAVSPTNFSINDAGGDRAYPIATYSWVILRRDYPDAGKGKAVVNLWKWFVGDGQQYGRDLQYAALPQEARDFALGQLEKLTAGGKAIQ